MGAKRTRRKTADLSHAIASTLKPHYVKQLPAVEEKYQGIRSQIHNGPYALALK